MNYFYLYPPASPLLPPTPSASPIFPNPSISFQNTSFLLQWCPSFLWPGHYIQYFNITVTNMRDNTLITFDLLNATFSDALRLVSYIYSIDSNQSELCTDLLFGLSAITSYGESLSTFCIKGEHSASKIRCIIIIIM